MSDDYRHLCAELARTAEAFGDGSRRDWRGLVAMRRAVVELERVYCRDMDQRERAAMEGAPRKSVEIVGAGMSDKCVCAERDPEDGA